MGRRKKELDYIHRDNIASAAERLFTQKGVQATTMDEIAKQAGYSKATLYVYFTSKEELLTFLIAKSMRMLHALIKGAITKSVPTKEKYYGICDALIQYQARYPLYFSLALSEIDVNPDRLAVSPAAKETYETGKHIEAALAAFIRSGSLSGDFRPDIPILQTVFLFWASLSGIIQMAANKHNYLEQAMHVTKEQFLAFSFERLYRLIAMEDAK